MATKDEAVKDTEEEKPPQKSKLMLIVLACTVLILGAGGFFGWKWYAGRKAEGETSGKKEKVSLVFPLKSFIVNLSDNTGSGKRYLKVSIELEVASEEKKVMVENNIPALRDSILLLLSSRSIIDVNTLEGKLELKQALLAKMNLVLGEGIIQRVYFTEFVVQ
ncbi:MAG: flagellar basal body-associated FliL family protein [Pseudomonadota bacterium]|uniref:Flagellar protein FliL n=1 Tax=Candidatus Desulfatibia profunda TaxID=2841695 RepID=A0A8J6NQY7_9BACT|nr:flagellar basal body-associated FliL family protein [Candidatus Desulfatibia profunda]MBL7179772.1 flagellar basal body-associated FliL family protein [Desulfobacterales bacterium]MBU0698785.1 flagellar basal body-associated FliL family protein [Pseudomonadota bacterium]